VDLAVALTADLASLSRALEEPDLDLETHLRRLIADLRRAVDSYLGLRMTVIVEGRRLSFATFTDIDPQPQIASSLMLPLAGATDLQDGSSLLLYAATPGAFVDLAADLGFALGLDLSALALDQHRATPTGYPGIEGLEPWRDVNQAIGVLIGRGHTIESAHGELRSLAVLGSGSVHHAAAALLATASEPGIDDGDQAVT
jgi:hypothetical protein